MHECGGERGLLMRTRQLRKLCARNENKESTLPPVQKETGEMDKNFVVILMDYLPNTSVSLKTQEYSI